MSILLESLRQSSQKKEKDIPGVGDSHFDDEMLSDEWLLAKLRMWKIICAVLVLAIGITSVGWFISATESVRLASRQAEQPTQTKLAETDSEIAQSADNQKLLKQSNNLSKQLDNSVPYGELTIESSVEAKQETQSTKQKYIPKKLEKLVAPSSSVGTNQSPSNQVQARVTEKSNSAVQQQSIASQFEATGSIIDYESLSQQQRNEMPELEISSYAVSSNSKKSFVVLNGAFYGQGETIAPNLALVSIEKESIVVRYFDQRIRKKYGL